MALLDEVGLGGHAGERVGTFSKGMQMRLNLARALVNDPDLLFLDEPTSGLDPVQVAQVRRLVLRRAEAGTTVFLTSHDMATVDALCHRVAFVTGGRIAAIDTPRRFRVTYGRPTVRVARRVGGRLDEVRFRLDELAGNERFLHVLAQGDVETIHTDEADLADVFIRLTGNRL